MQTHTQMTKEMKNVTEENKNSEWAWVWRWHFELHAGRLCEVQPEAERLAGWREWKTATWRGQLNCGEEGTTRNPQWLRVMGLPGHEYFRHQRGVLLRLSRGTHNMGPTHAIIRQDWATTCMNNPLVYPSKWAQPNILCVQTKWEELITSSTEIRE